VRYFSHLGRPAGVDVRSGCVAGGLGSGAVAGAAAAAAADDDADLPIGDITPRSDEIALPARPRATPVGAVCLSLDR
jgi:hypothetical protein